MDLAEGTSMILSLGYTADGRTEMTMAVDIIHTSILSPRGYKHHLQLYTAIHIDR